MSKLWDILAGYAWIDRDVGYIVKFSLQPNRKEKPKIAKNKLENLLKIAKAGAVKPLILLISLANPQLQEYDVTAILNLSLCDENKEFIASSGAIKPLVRALRLGTPMVKENLACALLRLSQVDENKFAIGQSKAIPLLVNLLESGGFCGKKDTSTALYSLCSVKENKIKAVQAGITKPLVEEVFGE
ncbi:U-box domain-containing protein 14-like [Quercus robur]|uniref:U-box domain-containing protein 14-like n=1 Tax=Quercus robur TaxID=38942 RepID=UPI00216293B9|nr:U-box domain-containing protein 14-like [Quercus robur]